MDTFKDIEPVLVTSFQLSGNGADNGCFIITHKILLKYV